MAGISYSGIELRKLPLSMLNNIGQLLDDEETWKRLMVIIPSERDPQVPKYTAEHMRLIERHGRAPGNSCGRTLIDEWSTSGRNRPTPETLLKLLVKCQAFRVADYVAVNVLSEAEPERPRSGPAAPVTREYFVGFGGSGHGYVGEFLEQLNNQDSESGNLINFKASSIEFATRNFDEAFQIGSGAFGVVYKIDLSQHKGPILAVKALNPTSTIVEEQFLTEIRVLSAYRHENLVQLIGFCSSAPRFCLVYEFLPGGSLLAAISCEGENSEPLPWSTRVRIMHQIAKGIRFLHFGKDEPLIHRDIKSANVLLDTQLVPKLGDFGLAKALPSSSLTSAQTSTIIGTSAYMAPEAFRGDVSPKMDIFSFGVIILELLTGLSPYDEDREEGNDIVTFVDDIVEDDDIMPLIDTKAGPVHNDQANSVYQLSQKCRDDKKKRPTSDRVVQELECIRARTDNQH